MKLRHIHPRIGINLNMKTSIYRRAGRRPRSKGDGCRFGKANKAVGATSANSATGSITMSES